VGVLDVMSSDGERALVINKHISNDK